MASTRLIFLLVCLLVLPTFLTFFSLLYSYPQNEDDNEPSTIISESGIRAFFSFRTPSALFPPSAIISLTDDNSTFFLARPAAFGSGLPSSGLSAQLWVGSGFGDDTIGRGGAATGAEGELGCSDVPGWEFRHRHDHGAWGPLAAHGVDEASNADKRNENPRGSEGMGSSSAANQAERSTIESDGTDDHLHHDLAESHSPEHSWSGESVRHRPPHADIQSLQESAEIAGKVVLLSRGGCGFLEKVKWVQRRGGTALIVGDDTRGGALVTMYAHGDTSNVTIPSLFTSHTTAHLLSSLIPLDGSMDAFISGDALKSGASQVAKDTTTEKGNLLEGSSRNRPTSKLGSNPVTATSLSQPRGPSSTSKRAVENQSWFGMLASRIGLGRRPDKRDLSADSTRPPRSARLDWVNEKWDDEPRKGANAFLDQVAGPKSQPTTEGDRSRSETSGDDFIIGVQDWRDPDLVAEKPSRRRGEHAAIFEIKPKSSSSKSDSNAEASRGNKFAGGIITPGSGEYGKTGPDKYESEISMSDQYRKSSGQEPTFQATGASKIQLSRHGSNDAKSDLRRRHQLGSVKELEGKSNDRGSAKDEFEEHDGLWVTLTPTTMSTSPFFDTLLVLVVSPLVTLTVVYALLLLRSRIRRRRWRAPKSLVDRLPVRTYNTVSCSSTSSASRFASPKNSTPTTPLLQTSPLPNARPRSRTTSGVGDSHQSLLNKAATKASKDQRNEAPRRPVWLKNYAGKQIECVVCLEEYVDGHSRVMSLPCGHEFHVECITPWLTTRRRTCPICKCDVVRSMAPHSSSAASTTSASHTRHDDTPSNSNHDDTQTQAALATNDSPSSAIPIPRSNNDLERGDDDLAATLVNDQPEEPPHPRRGWIDLASLSLSAFSGEVAWRQAQVDRNR